MKIRMQTGLTRNSSEVEAVLQKARVLGLIPEVEFVQGTAHPLTEIALKDGSEVKCASLPDYPFRSMQGVEEVVRITPPRVQLAHNALAGHHRIQLGKT